MESEIAYAMFWRVRIGVVPSGALAFSSRNFSMFLTFLKAYIKFIKFKYWICDHYYHTDHKDPWKYFQG